MLLAVHCLLQFRLHIAIQQTAPQFCTGRGHLTGTCSIGRAAGSQRGCPVGTHQRDEGPAGVFDVGAARCSRQGLGIAQQRPRRRGHVHKCAPPCGTRARLVCGGWQFRGRARLGAKAKSHQRHCLHPLSLSVCFECVAHSCYQAQACAKHQIGTCPQAVGPCPK